MKRATKSLISDPVAVERRELAKNKKAIRKLIERPHAKLLTDLLEMRLVLEPQRVYIRALLNTAGEYWDRRQLYQQVGVELGKHGAGTDRQYRLSMASQNISEKHTFDLCCAFLSDPERWEAIPPSCRLEARASNVFRRLFQSMCQLHKTMAKNRSDPNKVLVVLAGVAVADTLKKDDDAYLRDSWSRKPMETHPDLCPKAASYDLLLMAVIAHQEQVALDCNRSSVRRSLYMFLTQTWRESLDALNTECCGKGSTETTCSSTTRQRRGYPRTPETTCR